MLRRHRLVELFLVQVMGMSWAEVHDEAEQLEHVVSERLIERIDEMLGTSDSRSARRSDSEPRRRDRHAPSREPADLPDWHAAAVTRIADQDPAFLRFIESNDLKPASRSRSSRATRRPIRCVVRGKDRARSPSARARRRSCSSRSIEIGAP